jgi:hypothetical protein
MNKSLHGLNTMVSVAGPDPKPKKKNDGYDDQVHSQPIVNEQEQDVIANAEPDPEPSSTEQSNEKEQKDFESESLPVAGNEAKREAGLNP